MTMLSKFQENYNLNSATHQGYTQHELEELQPEKGNYGGNPGGYTTSAKRNNKGNYGGGAHPNEYKQYLTKSRTHRGKFNCPVCGGGNFGVGPNGYTCFSNGCDGSAIKVALLKLSGEWVEPGQKREWLSKDEWLKQKREREAEAKAINQANNARSKIEKGKAKPSDIELDKVYREFLNGLTLDADHAAAISDRGISTELANELMYRTIPNAKALTPLNPLGRFHLKCGRALALPVMRNGLIVGCQLRPDNTSFGKYIWLTNGGIHRQNGELPSALLPPLDGFSSTFPGEMPNVLNVCEGIGFKGALAHFRLKTWLWAIAGCNFGSYEESFLEAIATARAYAQALSKALTVILNADSGSLLNENVYKGYKELYELCLKHGVEFKIRWWGQLEKAKGSATLGDIDEIDDETLSKAKLISWEEFEKLKRDSKDRQAYFARLKFTPNITMNLRYFTYPLPTTPSIVAIKSGCATGKTHNFKAEFEAKLSELGLIAVGYRNSLLYQFCEELKALHINDGTKWFDLRDPEKRLAVCINSLLKIPAKAFDDTVLVLDEVVGIIKTLLHSPLIKPEDQILLISHLKEALTRARLVLIMDTNLTDDVCDLLTRYSGGKPLTKILNLPQNLGIEVEMYQGKLNRKGVLKESDTSALIREIYSATNPIAIAIDSQKKAEALEIELKRRGRKGLRIDRKTIEEPEVKEFLANPNAWIEAHQPDYLIYTPSIESGVDIKVDYFDKQYCLFHDVVDVDAAEQMLMRIRSATTKRIVWAKTFANSDSEFYHRSFDPPIIEVLRKRKVMVELNAIAQEDEVELTGELLGRFFDETIQPWCKLSAQLTANRNYERAHFRECLIKRLMDSQMNLTIRDYEEATLEDKEAKKTLADDISEVIDKEAKKIFNADAIAHYNDNEQELTSTRKTGRTYDNQCSEKKTYLITVLPGIETKPEFTPEFVRYTLFDSPKIIQALELRYLLDNLESAKLRDRNRLRFIAEKTTTTVHYPVWRQLKLLSAKLKALKALEIESLISHLQAGNTISADHPLVVAMVEKGKERFVADALGFKPGKKPMVYVRNVLKLLGYQLTEQGTRKTGRKFKLHPPEVEVGTYFFAILDCLNTRYISMAQKGDKPLYTTEITGKGDKPLYTTEITGKGDKPLYTTEITGKGDKLEENMFSSSKQLEPPLNKENIGDKPAELCIYMKSLSPPPSEVKVEGSVTPEDQIMRTKQGTHPLTITENEGALAQQETTASNLANPVVDETIAPEGSIETQETTTAPPKVYPPGYDDETYVDSVWDIPNKGKIERITILGVAKALAYIAQGKGIVSMPLSYILAVGDRAKADETKPSLPSSNVIVENEDLI